MLIILDNPVALEKLEPLADPVKFTMYPAQKDHQDQLDPQEAMVSQEAQDNPAPTGMEDWQIYLFNNDICFRQPGPQGPPGDNGPNGKF